LLPPALLRYDAHFIEKPGYSRAPLVLLMPLLECSLGDEQPEGHASYLLADSIVITVRVHLVYDVGEHLDTNRGTLSPSVIFFRTQLQMLQRAKPVVGPAAIA